MKAPNPSNPFVEGGLKFQVRRKHLNDLPKLENWLRQVVHWLFQSNRCFGGPFAPMFRWQFGYQEPKWLRFLVLDVVGRLCTLHLLKGVVGALYLLKIDWYDYVQIINFE